jgi:DNA uptake protein ComE-like DNA-binding protein
MRGKTAIGQTLRPEKIGYNEHLMKQYLLLAVILLSLIKYSPSVDSSQFLVSLDLSVKRQIDLNRDPLLYLIMLPGVGPKKAELILNNRPYSSKEEVIALKGISARHLELWRALIKDFN